MESTAVSREIETYEDFLESGYGITAQTDSE